jgi:hypothetical protein
MLDLTAPTAGKWDMVNRIHPERSSTSVQQQEKNQYSRDKQQELSNFSQELQFMSISASYDPDRKQPDQDSRDEHDLGLRGGNRRL